MPKLLIIFGSKSDSYVYDKLTALLEKNNIDFELKICSAHKNPELLDEILKKKYDLVIAGAGLSAALPGVIASKITAPVIGIPCPAEFNGLDSFLSILQMPPGIPVLCTPINNVKTAAETASKFFKNPKTLAVADFSSGIMSEIANGAVPYASAQGKPAISEHAQEHALGFSPAVLDKTKKATEILDKFRVDYKFTERPNADINIIIQDFDKIKIIKNNKINIYCAIKEKTTAEDSIKLLKTVQGLWVGINSTTNAAIAAAQLLGKEKEILEYRKELTK